MCSCNSKRTRPNRQIPRGRNIGRNPDGTLAPQAQFVNNQGPQPMQPNVSQINTVRPMNYDRLRIEKLRQEAIAKNRGTNI
jgi:hypothetical protein